MAISVDWKGPLGMKSLAGIVDKSYIEVVSIADDLLLNKNNIIGIGE